MINYQTSVFNPDPIRLHCASQGSLYRSWAEKFRHANEIEKVGHSQKLEVQVKQLLKPAYIALIKSRFKEATDSISSESKC